MSKPVKKILFLLGLMILAWLILVRGVLGQETFPWTDQFVQKVVAAETPQDAVGLVLSAFNEPGSSGINFSGGVTVTVDAETWLVVATDWGADIPAEAEPLNIVEDSGYGAWLIAGPWEGFIPSGVGVSLAEEVEVVPTTFTVYLPFISTPPSPWMSAPLVQQALAAASPADSVAFVLGVFNDPTRSGGINFAANPTLSVAAGQAYLVAVDWGDADRIGAIPVNVTEEGAYGTWVIPGPWNGAVPGGVGVPLH